MNNNEILIRNTKNKIYKIIKKIKTVSKAERSSISTLREKLLSKNFNVETIYEKNQFVSLLDIDTNELTNLIINRLLNDDQLKSSNIEYLTNIIFNSMRLFDENSQKYFVEDEEIRNNFLLGYCDVYALSKKLRDKNNEIIIVNDDKKGKNRISLYHALLKNSKNNRYYDANGLIALNNDMLKKYIKRNYSENDDNFTIISEKELVKKYLSTLFGFEEAEVYDEDNFNFYLEENSNIEEELLEYL